MRIVFIFINNNKCFWTEKQKKTRCFFYNDEKGFVRVPVETVEQEVQVDLVHQIPMVTKSNMVIKGN